MEEYHTGDVIWIHDYHLLLVPNMVRAKLPKARIGLFVHSPFPSSELFRCLPSKLSFFFLFLYFFFFNLCPFIRTSRDLEGNVGSKFGWISGITPNFFFFKYQKQVTKAYRLDLRKLQAFYFYFHASIRLRILTRRSRIRRPFLSRRYVPYRY